MKITQLRDKDKTTALTTMDMETWIEKTRTETKMQPVSAFREVLRYSLPDSRCYEADKLPKILPAAEFRRTEGGKQMKSYNGIVDVYVAVLSIMLPGFHKANGCVADTVSATHLQQVSATL